MNAVMRIQVRVINGASPEIRMIQRDMASLAKTAAAANRMIVESTAGATAATAKQAAATRAATTAQRGFGAAVGMSNLEKFGKNLQWTGRQIEFNFTLPLVLATAMATKWALEQEKAFVRVKKVYGDQAAAQQFFQKQGMSAFDAQTKAAQVFSDELDALNQSFTALSTQYGVNKKDVNEIASDWAAAGASGLALAQSVRLTMEAMILGDMSGVEATKSLIAIQAQYGASTAQLKDILGALNSVENATGATMNDLIVSFSKSAGAAANAGVSYRQLAALTAALVPASGSAANAGNALKTIFSRLLVPTKDAITALNDLGLGVNTVGWQSKTAFQRLEAMSSAFVHVNKNVQNTVTSFVASRYQVNRFAILMDELQSKTGFFAKALRATDPAFKDLNGNTKIAAQYNSELQAVLQSNPKKFDILKESIRNALVDAILPFIPAILSMMKMLVGLANSWNKVDPALQKFIFSVLAFIAVFGTMNRLVGAAILLLVRLGATFFLIARIIASPFLLAIKIMQEMVIATQAMAVLVVASTQAMWAGIKAVSLAGWAALKAIQATQMFSMVALWATELLVMLLSWEAFTTALAAIYLAGSTRLYKVVEIAGAGLTAVWGAVKAGVLAVETGFWAALAAIQAAGVAVMAAVGVDMAAVWFFVTEAWATVAVAAAGFWASLETLWLVGVATIEQITAGWVSIGFLMTTIWDLVLAAGAALWAGLGVLWAAGVAAIETFWIGMAAGQFAIVAAWGLLLDGAAALWAGLEGLWAAGIVAITTMTITWEGVMWGVVAILPKIIDGFMVFWAGVQALFAAGWAAVTFITTVGASSVVAAYEGMIFVITKLGPMLLAALTSPWTALFVGLAAVVYTFRDNMGKVIDNIVQGFQRMPAGIAGAFVGIIHVIAKGVEIVRDALSYLNPFQRHSPSLVDNVKAGVAVIGKHYRKIATVHSVYKKAGQALGTFTKATKNYTTAYERHQQAEQRRAVVGAAGPAAGKAYDGLIKAQKNLKAAMDPIAHELDIQKAKLDSLQAKAKALGDALNKAKDNLQSFLNAPLVGEKAMNQAILDNSVAQAKLKLQMMNITDAIGPIDKVKDRLSALAGETEMLRGTQADLRAAGAGSEILKPYQDQINAIQANSTAIQGQIHQYDDLQSTLDQLQATADRMDLEKFLNFDAVHQQMQLLADTTKELTSGEILAGIQKYSAEVANLQPQYDAATAAVDKQQAAVDKLQATYDKLKNRYDEINNALERFKELSSSGGSGGKGGMSPAEQALANAKKGNFKDAGLGNGLPQRTDWNSQAQQIIDDMMKNSTDAMSGLDMFKPFKDMWKGMIDWLNKNVPQNVQDFVTNFINTLKANMGAAVATAGIGTIIGFAIGGPAGAAVGAALGVALAGTLSPKKMDALVAGVKSVFDTLKTWGVNTWHVVMIVWDAFFVDIWRSIVDIGKAIFNFAKGVGKDMRQAFKGVDWGSFFKKVMVLLGALVVVWKVVWPILWRTARPVLTGLLGIIRFVFKIIFNLIAFFINLINGDFGKAFKNLGNIVIGMFQLIGSILHTVFGPIVGFFMGIVHGIINAFQWLSDVLVGHSIIPDMCDAIMVVFNWLAGAIGPVFDVIKAIITAAFTAIAWTWDNIVKPVFMALVWYVENVLGPVFSWLWNNIIKPVFGWIGSKIKVVWESVIKPALKGMWSFIKNDLGPAFGWLWDKIGPIFTWIGNRISDVWKNFIKPTFQRIADFVNDTLIPAFDALKTGISSAFKGVANTARIPINFVIDDIYNKGIKALFDKIAGAVGLSWKLPKADTIPKFAKGGRVDGPGSGTSDSIHAMLSRGEHVWTAKEVAAAGGHNAVARLRGLFNGKSLSRMQKDAELGGEKFGLGGAWNWVKDKAKDGKDWAVNKTLGWVANRAKDTINLISSALGDSNLVQLGSGMAKTLVDKTLTFAASAVGTDFNSPIGNSAPNVKAAQDFANSQKGKPYVWGASGPDGYDCSGFMSAIANVMQGKSKYSRRGTTADFPWAGFKSGDGLFTIGSNVKFPGSDVGHMAGTVGDLNVEARGGLGVLTGKGARGAYSQGFNQHAYLMRNGALVKARAGGVLARIGEGRHDEAVVPLPNGYRKDLGGGKREVNFYGDLSFPNITDPNDAEKFIENLEALAGGGQ